jgi:hypothetical protein
MGNSFDEEPAYSDSIDAFYGSTHERAKSSRGARRSSLQRLLRGAVRSVKGTGQTGRQGESAKSDERSPGRDPVRASTHRVVLGSAGHLERLQTSRRRRNNSRWRLKKLGFGEKYKDDKK